MLVLRSGQSGCHCHLPAAKFWYNTSLHSSLDSSPFEALYGHKPRLMILFLLHSLNGCMKDPWCRAWYTSTFFALEPEWSAMHIRTVSERTFSPDDWVYRLYEVASLRPVVRDARSSFFLVFWTLSCAWTCGCPFTWTFWPEVAFTLLAMCRNWS
jgi:hypothetical protein